MLPGFAEGFCPVIQSNLNDAMSPNGPSGLRSHLGYVQALIDEYNKSGFNYLQLDFGKGGHNHPVEVFYSPRLQDSDVGEVYDDCLTAGIEKTPLSEIVNLEQYTYVDYVFKDSSMSSLCQSKSEWITKAINDAFNAIYRNINSRAITLQGGAFGTFVGGDPSRTYTIVAPTVPPSPNTFEFGRSLIDYMETERTGQPIYIAGRNMLAYQKMVNAGCCNIGGVDTAALNSEYNFWYDSQIDGILGVNHAAILAPGAVQFLEWFEYGEGSDFAQNIGSEEDSTIIDPRSGMKFDIRIVRDSTCKKWIMRISKHWDLFFQPADAIDAGDPLAGTNGTLEAILN